MKTGRYVGVLTAGGDSPGLNAALRGIGKAGLGQYDMKLIGFLDGFRGLMQNRTIRLDENNFPAFSPKAAQSWGQVAISRIKCRSVASSWI